MLPRAPLVLPVLLVGCSQVAVDSYQSCELELAFDRTTALPGETVVATGGPMTDAGIRDLRVEVGGEPAQVLTVTRTSCDACDTCREEAVCSPCGPCNGRLLDAARRAECFGDPLASPPVVGSCAACAESMSFAIPPDAPPGPTRVWITNGAGSSDPLPFEVLGSPRTTGDTGSIP